MTGDDTLADAMTHDWRTAQLSERERNILVYAEKLTCSPERMTAADVGALRSVGLSEAEILGVVLVIAFFHMANRVADGLGVELDAQLTRGTEAYDQFMSR